VIVQRYIGRSLVMGWGLTLAVLASVFWLLTFIEQLDALIRDYDALAASRYALLSLPNQMVSLAPVIALLGSILALASLDRYNELTVISTSGVGLGKLLTAVLLPTLALMAALWVCMEYVTPQLQLNAERERIRLRHGDSDALPGGGLWSTDGQRYVHIRTLSRDLEPGGISLFEFDRNGRLSRAVRARSAWVFDDRRWLLRKVREKVLVDGELQTRGHPELEVANLFSRDELPTLNQQGDTMHLSLLRSYAQYLIGNGQPAERYLWAFWQKLLLPFTVLAMVLLATPISAGATAGRERSLGLSVGIGALLGILFYLGAQIVFALGQLLDWNIPLVAALPSLIIFGIAAVMLLRMRW